MKICSAGVDEILNGAQYSYENGRLGRWRFVAMRALYLATLFLLRRLAA